jgi:hypothetical protein
MPAARNHGERVSPSTARPEYNGTPNYLDPEPSCGRTGTVAYDPARDVDQRHSREENREDSALDHDASPP